MDTRMKWGLGAAAVLVVLAAVALGTTRGVPVRTVAVTRGAIAQSVVATGRVEASARIDLGSEVTATVREVRVREGDRVRAGQVLVRLSDDEARAALAQAEAALLEARERAREQSGVTAPVSAQALAQAEANLKTAEREAERARALVAQGFFAPQKADEAERALANARSALEAARVQARANAPGEVGARLVRTRVEQAESALAAARARLARLNLASPVDAMVLTRHVEPGSMAQPGRALLGLAAEGPLRIDAAIDEKNLRLVSVGMAAQAVADAYPGQSFAATVSWIAPAVDAQRGTVPVRLAVPQPPGFLRPDMTVSVEILGGEKKDALVLSAAAVRDADREAPWVLVVQEGRAARVPVKLGLRGIGAVEITEGLAEGARVIPQTEKAAPGDRVREVARSDAQRPMDVPQGMISR
ncbi:efflux RND transporter periplasmic adaptor subunit [Tibeticola sediminis]|nr:efflux RND transporter periplasmic adaptor subunit [Tibeticola sediminis]